MKRRCETSYRVANKEGAIEACASTVPLQYAYAYIATGNVNA